MIDLDSSFNKAVQLINDESECTLATSLFEKFKNKLSLQTLWNLVDAAWIECVCDNRCPAEESVTNFYSHPVWISNGIFTEADQVSMDHRMAIAHAIASFKPDKVLDFGGEFGTLARLMAEALPDAEINICEPYPPRHGIESCKPFANIHFVPELSKQNVDVLVSTDVLEHVPDPITMLASMVHAVRPGGHLLTANCFYPVILCHLPCTFHLRYSFESFCQALGLQVLGPCEGSHATIYQRVNQVNPDWPRLRKMEHRSQLLFPLREWKAKRLTPWGQRAKLAATQPLHYPRKLGRVMRIVD
jgi:hypothetical protein